MSLVDDNPGRYELDKALPTQDLRSRIDLQMLIIAQIVEILRDLQDLGFAHNDVHFGNFVFSEMADPAGTLKLIDFALLRHRS